MAEEQKSNGLFWALLLVLGGGAAWAINKYVISPKGKSKKTTTKKVSTKSGGVKTDTNTVPQTSTTNEATLNGFPFSLDLKNVVKSSPIHFGKITTYAFKYITNPLKYIIFADSSGKKWYYLKNLGKPNAYAYQYSAKDGSFVSKVVLDKHGNVSINNNGVVLAV